MFLNFFSFFLHCASVKRTTEITTYGTTDEEGEEEEILAATNKLEAEKELRQVVEDTTCASLRRKSLKLLDERHEALHKGNTNSANMIMALIKNINPVAFTQAAKKMQRKIKRKLSSTFSRKDEEEEEASAISDDSFSVAGYDAAYAAEDDELGQL